MRVFAELARRAFRRSLSYRAATLAGLLTNLFFGLLRASVLIALYGGSEAVAGYSVQDVITYAGLTQAIIAYLNFWGWFDLMNSVYTGEVAGDLLKPIPLFKSWLARDAGRALLNLLLRGIPLMLLYSLFFDITYPSDALQWLAVVLSLVLAWLLGFAWAFLVNLAAFWSPNARGIGRFAFIVPWFFSGFLMPIRFFPDWLQHLAALTPFPHMVNTIVDVYLGVLRGPELLGALGLQLFWMLILALLAQGILMLGLRRLVVLGG